ncbi:hypothetical protein NQZ68_007327 [Dissostichus eleginoides]|nr:hypothetical protein NQZ68_007327 [Dissostichus eleginoides]
MTETVLLKPSIISQRENRNSESALSHRARNNSSTKDDLRRRQNKHSEGRKGNISDVLKLIFMESCADWIPGKVNLQDVGMRNFY